MLEKLSLILANLLSRRKKTYKIVRITSEVDIKKAVIKSISAFGVDFTKPYQTISFVGLQESRRDISVKDFVAVLKIMKGVELDIEKNEIRVPTHYFQ